MEWINVKDKVPPVSEMVILWGIHWLTPLTGWRIEDNLYRVSGTGPYFEDVTHWQPLPKTPKTRFEIIPKLNGRLIRIGPHNIYGENLLNVVDWLNDLLKKGILTYED